MRTGHFVEEPPKDCQTIQGLRFARGQFENGGRMRYTVKAWRPKGARPYAHYYFDCEVDRERWVADQVERERRRIAAKRSRAEQRSADSARMADVIQVGTILHYSWGWEQTQCDYFQVTQKRGRKVAVRAIQSRRDDSRPDGSMSEYRKPCPGEFCGDEIWKVIGPYGLSMDHGTATPCTADASHYCSWYG